MGKDSHTKEINAHAWTFLKYLCGEASDPIISVAWFFADDKTVVPQFGSRSHPLSYLQKEYDLVTSLHPDRLIELHIAVNETNGKGKTLDDIRNPRAILVDIDIPIPKEAFSALIDWYKPDWAVRSSPGKYHLYWKISPTIPLPVWADLQLAFASRLGADLEKCQVTSLIRVPGFTRHLKKSNKLFTPTIVYQAKTPFCLRSYKTLLKTFPWIPKFAEKGKQLMHAQRSERARVAARIAADMQTTGRLQPGFKFKTVRHEGGRNTALYSYVKQFVSESGSSLDVTSEIGNQLNDAFTPPLLPREANVAISSGWKKGMVMFKKQEERTRLLIEGISPAPQKKDKTSNSVPRHIPEAAKYFAQRLWKEKENRLTIIKALHHANTSGDFSTLVDYLTERFMFAGATRQSIPALSIRQKSRWGSSVVGSLLFDRESFTPFCAKVFQSLLRLARRAGKKEPKFLEYTKKPISHSRKKQLAEAWFQDLSVQPNIERQPAHLIVFQNGVYDLTTRKFAADPDAPTKYSHPIWANYIPGEVSTPTWDKYLSDWFPRDPEIRRFFFRWFGYSFTTDTSRQCFAFFFGDGGAGKGSVAQTLCSLAGSPNYTSLQYDAFDSKFALSSIADKLVVSVDECESDHELQHERRLVVVKKITGGERFQIERKYAQPFEDDLPAKMTLQANEILRYQDKGGSIKRRMVAVGFQYPYPDAGGTKLIPDIILESDADAMATLAARYWAKARLLDRPFDMPNCKAIQYGNKNARDKLNIYAVICQQYLVTRLSARISGQALIELAKWIRLQSNLRENIRNGQVTSEIEVFFGSKITKSKHIKSYPGGPEVRGYVGLEINRKALLDEYPELEATPHNFMRDFPYLLKALGLMETVPVIHESVLTQ